MGLSAVLCGGPQDPCTHQCQDAGPRPAFPWNDLLPELREDVLDKVPLLRLAQLAVLCKEFRAAYRKRQEGQKRSETLLPCPLVQPLDPGFWKSMPLAFDEPEMVERRWWVSPRFHGGIQWGSSLSPLQGMHIMLWSVRPGLCSKVATSTVKGCYMARASSEPCSATVRLRCVLMTGFRRRWLVCTELLLDCSDAPIGVPATIGILMGIRVAPTVRKFLDRLVGGVPNGLPRRGEAGPVGRVRLVLPEGTTWPDVEGMDQICDALTTIAKTAGSRPSSVQICVKNRWGRAHTWRLPGTLP